MFRQSNSLKFIAFLLLLNLISCSKVINTGEYRGLKVGMSKENVVNILIESGVKYVTPVVETNISIKKNNMDNLDSLRSATGICVTDNTGFSFNLKLSSDGKPILTYASISAKEDSQKFFDAKTILDVFRIIKEMFNYRSGLVVSNCILTNNIKLIDFQAKKDLNLLHNNYWLYVIPGSYSTLKLSFHDNLLTKMEYDWKPFEGF